jgi:hypothetical protein
MGTQPWRTHNSKIAPKDQEKSLSLQEHENKVLSHQKRKTCELTCGNWKDLIIWTFIEVPHSCNHSSKPSFQSYTTYTYIHIGWAPFWSWEFVSQLMWFSQLQNTRNWLRYLISCNCCWGEIYTQNQQEHTKERNSFRVKKSGTSEYPQWWICSICELAKIFQTSKISSLLFLNPTQKTETGTANSWETTNELSG